MKRLLATLLLLGSSAFAASQSLTIPANGLVEISVPNVAPFSAINDFRLVFQMHNWTLPPSGNVTLTGLPLNVVAFHLYSTGLLCAIGSVLGDQQGDRGNINCINVSGLTNVLIRYQRFHNLPDEAAPPSHLYAGQTEVMGTDESTGAILPMYCATIAGNNSFGCPLQPTGGGASFSAAGNATWGTTVGFSVAWFKWFSTTVPLGSPLENESTQADLADFRFEGTCPTAPFAACFTNSATTPGVTMQTYGATNPTFTGSPIQAPVCYPVQATYRAGSPATLGNASYTLDGSAPSYTWQQTSGPSTLLWSSHRTAAPVISGGVSGTYNLTLTVAGTGGGGATTCPVKVGFVAVDANNIIVTGNPAVNTLLGPQILDGANQWAWADAMPKNWATMLMHWQQPGQYYGNDFWNLGAAGTVSYATGSNIVTGNATSLNTLFCAPPSYLTPDTETYIQLWNPNALLQPMKRRMQVASCQGPTQITLTSNWNTTGVSAVSDCHLGGCNYNYSDASEAYQGLWDSNTYFSNFYDAVAGFYALYYRTGIDTYQAAARTLADNFWIDIYDSGNNYYINAGLQASPRNRALLGMVLRAMDGRPDMWAGLETVFAFEIDEISRAITNDGGNLQPGHFFNSDPRESGYMMEGPGFCAIADTENPTMQTTCQAALVNAIEHGLKTSQFPDGNWYSLYEWGGGCGTGGTHACNNRATGTTLQLTNGQSTALLCDSTGTICPATSGAFPAAAFLFNLNGQNYPAALWPLTSTTAAPSSNADGLPYALYMQEGVDGYHINLTDFTLTHNPAIFTGASGIYGWSTGNGQAGYGIQPYMLGILGTSADFAAKGLAGYDATATCGSPGCAIADAKAFNIQMADYNMANSYNPANGSMYYAVHFTSCQPPIAAGNPGCTDLNTTSQGGSLTSEALRGIMTAYGNNGDPALLAFADKLYTQQWAKPGYAAPAVAVDLPGSYNWDWNQWDWPMTGGLGNNGGGTPPGIGIHKYFGQAAGIGGMSAWPGYRAGGLAAPISESLSIGFNLAAHPGATSAVFTSTEPTTTVVSNSCSSSPCSITVTGGYGGHLLAVTYKNAGGAIVAASSTAIALGQ